MNSSFDLVKLNALLKDFHQLTHMRITVYDDSIQEITAHPRRIAPICRYIRTDPRAEAACHACDASACRESRRLRAPYIYRCHAGLTEAVTPVFMGNMVIAYLSFGHLFSYPTLEEGRESIRSCCSGYALDEETLDDYISELHETSESFILSAANILEAVASFLCLDHMILLKQQAVQFQVDEYISKHFTEDISVDTLCRLFGIGRTTLYVFAKQNYGMGIAQHIRALRIAHARKLLIERPDMNISEVAEACGFKDYNYFITVFGRMAGVAPRQYRLNAVNPDTASKDRR
ncbi:MAG: PocR ligand-binding domain-containing protein [Clostridia bacterium]|nr:PocR ligand-binding domain-containing protein [Clostridia bacterium]